LLAAISSQILGEPNVLIGLYGRASGGIENDFVSFSKSGNDTAPTRSRFNVRETLGEVNSASFNRVLSFRYSKSGVESDMSREFRQILRVAGTSIDGTKKLVYGITKIRGVGPSYAVAIVRASELKPELRMGDLSEAEVQKLEDVMKDPAKYGLPSRLFNRRKDLESGRDTHLIGPDLTLSVKTDIDFMQDIRTWKGVRHSLGLKVRGQRTRTTGRKGRAVGVAKKVIMEAARAAAVEKEKEEKK
jgi:small subunit ribosomal protein S13